MALYSALTFWNGLFDWVDERRIFRRSVLAVVMVWSWLVLQWAMAFAGSSERPGSEIALIIAAVVTPLSALQAHALAVYSASRHDK